MTILFEILVIFFSVFLIAIISAGLGIGGGIFSVPLLLYIGKFHSLPRDSLAHIAIANSLLFTLILSSSATYVNIKTKKVHFNLAMNFLLGSIPGAMFGVYVSKFLKTKELTVLFGLLVLTIGATTLIRSFRKKNPNRGFVKKFEFYKKYKVILLILIGFVTGLLSSLTGVGGGIIMVPLFSVILYNEPYQKSIATSTFSMVVITLSSTLLYAMQTKGDIPEPSIGYYYLPFTIPLVLAAMPGGYLGAKLKEKLPSESLRRTLAVLQILIGLKTIFF
jgi:uncharacterized membrane protein YfcA